MSDTTKDLNFTPEQIEKIADILAPEIEVEKLRQELRYLKANEDLRGIRLKIRFALSILDEALSEALRSEQELNS